MKSISKIIALVLAMLANGCGEQKQEAPAKAAEPAVFKTQLEAMDKAKQVEGVVQEADERQREAIDAQSQ